MKVVGSHGHQDHELLEMIKASSHPQMGRGPAGISPTGDFQGKTVAVTPHMLGEILFQVVDSNVFSCSTLPGEMIQFD